MSANLLNLVFKALCYNDLPATSNPIRRAFDWGRSLQGVSVSNPKQNSFSIPANSSLQIFTGTRSTNIDATTRFTLTVSSLSSNRYRFTATSGTPPVFVTDRALTPNGHTMTWVSNNNATSTLTSSTSGDFTAAQVGDAIWVPGLTTGDAAGPFNAMNEGQWVVLSKDSTSTILQLARVAIGGYVNYLGTSEAVVVTSNSQVQAFSAAGVQVGDSVDISAGFSLPIIQSYVVAAVTPTWFEVITSSALPVSTIAAPGVGGIVFYNVAKRLVIVETDQEAAVQVNADTTSSNNRVSPIAPGDPDNCGFYWKFGPTWQLTVVNRSLVPMNTTVLTAE